MTPVLLLASVRTIVATNPAATDSFRSLVALANAWCDVHETADNAAEPFPGSLAEALEVLRDHGGRAEPTADDAAELLANATYEWRQRAAKAAELAAEVAS